MQETFAYRCDVKVGEIKTAFARLTSASKKMVTLKKKAGDDGEQETNVISHK
jgi:hypothetical protein